MDDLRFPIGQYVRPAALDGAQRRAAIEHIRGTPAALRRAVEGLDDPQLDTPYRPGGWTVRQVTHHVPDSHLNAYIRCKWALTETTPTIKAYDEAAWARLPDSRLPVGVSLGLLDAVHERWLVLLESLTDAQWTLTFVHPESGPTRLDQLAALYSWHGRHHTAHITQLRQRMGW